MEVKIKMIRPIVLVVLLSSTQFASGTPQPTVTLKDGTILQGVTEECNRDLLPVHAKLESYYGIPYAEAPVGPLRFKPPVPKKKLDSPFDATKIGSSCMQPDSASFGVRLGNMEISEDCLFLDVIVPKSAPENAHVFVSIHGGAFIMGAGQMSFLDFLIIASYGNIIVVSFNYRLGPFGFLTTDDNLLPGNLGLFDQQLALKWVNENIEAFGGDPNKVTIGGISAGGASVAFHTLSPGSKGLFRHAMIESGSPFDSWITYRQGEEARLEVKTLAKLIGCSPEDIEDDSKLLDCLMEASAEDINENIAKVGQKLGKPFFPPPGPNVDGVFLPKDAVNILQEGTLNGESYVVGSDAEEGTVLLWMLHSDKNVKPVVNSTTLSEILSTGTIGDVPIGNVPNSIAQKLMKVIYTIDEKELVNEDQDDYFHEVSQFLGDVMFFCGASKFARLASQSKNVYRFTMTYVPSSNVIDVKWTGATHGEHAQFVYGKPFEENLLDKGSDEERNMSRKVMQYWINFMKTGDPNIAEDVDHLPLPDWPKFTKEDQVYKDLTPDMENIYMKKRECYFMDNVFLPLRDAFNNFKSHKTSDDEKSKWTEEGRCEGKACHLDEEKP